MVNSFCPTSDKLAMVCSSLRLRSPSSLPYRSLERSRLLRFDSRSSRDDLSRLCSGDLERSRGILDRFLNGEGSKTLGLKVALFTAGFEDLSIVLIIAILANTNSVLESVDRD